MISPIKCDVLSRCECSNGCHTPDNFLPFPILLGVPLCVLGVWAYHRRVRTGVGLVIM